MPLEKLREYLTFTKRERIGIVVLIFILIALLIIPELYKKNSLTINQEEIRKYEEAMASLSRKADTESKEGLTGIQPEKSTARLSPFDPNKLEEKGWKLWGLDDHVIQTIDHFRKKGGHFREPEDLQKIYGLSEEKFRSMLPYIQIQHEPGYHGKEFPNKKYIRSDLTQRNNQQKFPEKKNPVHSLIDINKADSNDFLNIYGIGPKLAGRIIHFREKLGGFYSIDQLAEIYGLGDSTFILMRTSFTIDNHAKDSLKKIDINHCDFHELRQHPYIRYAVAKLLIEYRNQHGPFLNLEDLEKLHAINKQILEKIIPYLKI